MKAVKTIKLRQRRIKKLQRRIIAHRDALKVHRDGLTDIEDEIGAILKRVTRAITSLSVAYKSLEDSRCE